MCVCVCVCVCVWQGMNKEKKHLLFLSSVWYLLGWLQKLNQWNRQLPLFLSCISLAVSGFECKNLTVSRIIIVSVLCQLSIHDRLVGLVVRRLPWERKIPGSNPAYTAIFSGASHTSDLKIDTPVATLPGAWRYRVSTGTGRPDVSILWLGEVERLICNFCVSVAARKIVCADPSLRYTSLLLGR